MQEIGRRSAMGLLAGANVWAGEVSYEEAAREIWRHTNGVPAEGMAVLRELVRYAALAPNGHNTQPWKFRLRTDGVDILPDFARRTPVVDPDDHHIWVSLGCAAENLTLAAAAFGLRAAVRVSSNGVHVDLTKAAAERAGLFEAIPRRQSTRCDYDGRALRKDELRALAQAAEAYPSVQTAVLTERAQLDRVRDLVVAGNTTQLGDPAFVEELKQWIRFGKDEAAARRDGLFGGAAGNPSVPRWLGSMMFGWVFTAKGENEKYAKQLRSSAGVAVFAAAEANPAGWVEAGRACERFLLRATALDIRTAFVNQPVEVTGLRAALAAEAALGARRPDLLVRFGHGPMMPVSLRRDVDAVLVS